MNKKDLRILKLKNNGLSIAQIAKKIGDKEQRVVDGLKRIKGG